MNMHPHLPAENDPDTGFALTGATLVLPDAIVPGGALRVRAGLIDSVEPEATGPQAVPIDGDVVMPGIVDVHTDHFEKHLLPRAHVRWDPLRAALAHDAQIIGAGVTTVFDSLCVGMTERNPTRREILLPMIEALETATEAGMLRAEHLVHLRCEITDPDVPALLDRALPHALARLASVMDHTPGLKQSRDIEHYIARRALESGRSENAVRAEIAETHARIAGVAARVRGEVVSRVRARGLPLMTHDDSTPEHVAESVAEGATINEFPTTLEAARLARQAGQTVVAGAPNYLRGGSQSGNVAVADLLAEGLVDILASDYVPRSILDAVFRLADDPALPIDLPAAARMATLTPARAAGLHDRGALEPGQRADLLQVGRANGQPFLKAVWREGRRVF